MGISYPKHLPYETTYDTITGKARAWNTSKPGQGDVFAKKTSVHLGKGLKYGLVTMNSKFYPETNNKSITQPNKDFIHTIKASHFDVGDPRPKSAYNIRNHYLSETKLNLNSKGNAQNVRAVLDEKKKADLRTNHFEIGGRTADFKTPMQTLQYRPGTAKQR